MMSTQIIVGVLVVIAVTVISNTEGIPRPQEFVEVDGFAFDGPVDRSGRIPTTRPPPIVVPTFTPPLVTPSDTPTSSTEASVVPSPEVAQCIQNCRFRVTSEYNPVCGTDRTVYSNPGMITCARLCGHNVSQAYLGPCTTAVRG